MDRRAGSRGLCQCGGRLRRARASDGDETLDPAARKQLVWDMQIKYATYAIGAAGVGIIAFILLSKSNQGKKKYAQDLKKLDRLDPNEGMPLT